MSGGRISQGVGVGLLGIEIGRNKVRMALLDPDAKVVDDAVERPIVKGGGPRDPIEEESSTRAAIEAGFERLGLTTAVPLMVGVTIGFPHCGVGSGPALRDWLADLSAELGEPIVHVGDHGVSYAPIHCIDFVRRVFEPIALHLDRIELAPVAASRMLESLRSGAVTLGSGVAWSARILDRDVLEAFEIIDGSFDEVMQVVSNGVAHPVEHLEGVFVDEELCRNRGLTVGSLAPAVGVAVALHDSPFANLLDGQLVGNQAPSRVSGPFPRLESSRTVPAPLAPEDRPVSGPSSRWDVADDLMNTQPAPAPAQSMMSAGTDQRPRGNGWDGLEGGEFGYGDHYDDTVTYKLRRQPGAAWPPEHRGFEHDPVQWAPERPEPRVIQQQAPPRDDLAGIEKFSPQPTSLDGGGFHVSDFLLGALLMLAIALTAALFLL